MSPQWQRLESQGHKPGMSDTARDGEAKGGFPELVASPAGTFILAIWSPELQCGWGGGTTALIVSFSAGDGTWSVLWL